MKYKIQVKREHKILKTLAVLLLMVGSFMLGMGSIYEASNKDIKQTMTQEYNRGYVNGRSDGFGEVVHCYKLNNEQLNSAYLSSVQAVARFEGISVQDALNFHCEE